MTMLIHERETYRILGACFEVYLRAAGLRLGIPANFGHYPKVEYERIALWAHLRVDSGIGIFRLPGVKSDRALMGAATKCDLVAAPVKARRGPSTARCALAL